MSQVAAIPELDPAGYARHPLHAAERVWVEKNCYIDIWIEVLHALQLDPTAMLAFTLAVDFEGDQWTFFKPPHEDLTALYGLNVQELYVWRPLLEHACEYLPQGKLISTEADAFWLPDTAGTDYRAQHTKTTVVLNRVDPGARRLDYFHNAGYFSLDGEDFERLFRVDAPFDASFMPLFAEYIRSDAVVRLEPQALREQSRQLLRKHVARIPRDNPLRRFHRRFVQEFPAMQAGGLPQYHVWAFGTLRQVGAAAELAALYLRWLSPDDPAWHGAAESLMRLSNSAKVFILKAARAVNSGKRWESTPLFEEMATSWDQAMAVIRQVQ